VSASLTIPGKQREYKLVLKKYGVANTRFGDRQNKYPGLRVSECIQNEVDRRRAFSADFPKDVDTSIIITETAARLLGFRKPKTPSGKHAQYRNLIGTQLWSE
jgi:putative ABC transport system permease protein